MNKEKKNDLTSKEDVLVISSTGYGYETVSKEEAENIEPTDVQQQER